MEYLIVDVDSRIIKIPEEVTHLGVKDDNETRTLKFQMPKVYKGLDLSDYSLEINFINANNKSDSALTENKQIDGDNITFEWCVGKSAYAKNGKVNFLVYAYLENEYGIKTNEWHTTWAKLDVLDGGNVNGAIAEENPRIIDEMLRRIRELENGKTGGTADAVQYIAQTLTEKQQTQARANIGAASSAEVSKLSATVNDLKENGTGTGVDETTVKEIVDNHLTEKSQPMGTLTINGQQYNGSKDVVVEVAASSGGGGTESAAEAQLATGTIVAETTAGTVTDTGVTLETLKQYKRFIFIFKGASNAGLQNTYLFFGGQQNGSIARSDSAGGYVYEYEWVNVEEGLLRCCNYWQGNPSLIRSIGSSCIVTWITGSFNNINSGGSYPYLFDLSGQEDTETLKINNSVATTIDYEWEVRGMTV